MKKIHYIFYYSLFWVTLLSCSKEEALTPNETNDNYFLIPADATDPESVLRREFYEKNEVHLLFNDTLCHEQRGTYEDGTPIWYTETIDLTYSLTGDGTDYFYTYFTDHDEKKKAIQFVEDYLFTRLSATMRPYSVLLLKALEEDYYGYYLQSLDMYLGYRCLAVNAGSVSVLNEQGKQALSNSILKSLMLVKIKNVSEATLERFWAYSKEFYGKTYAAAGVPEDQNYQYDYSKAYSRGLIQVYYNMFTNAEYDLESYIKALFDYTEEEFKNQYADYPIVHEKYDVLKQIIQELGVVF